MLGGLIGTATSEKDGLMSKKRYDIGFDTSDSKVVVVKYNHEFYIQPFMAYCYASGLYGLAIVNPSVHNNLNDFKAVMLGIFQYDIYAKVGDANVYLVPQKNDGNIQIQFIAAKYSHCVVEQIDASEFVKGDYTKITLQSLG